MAFYIGEIVKLRGDFFEAHKNGEYLESVVLGKKIIDLYNANNDCDTMEYAVDLHNLGIAYDDICMYEKAIYYYKASSDLKKKLSGESITYADTLNNLAIAYSNLEHYEKAVQLQKQVLHIRSNILDRNHMDYIMGLFNLGNAYEDVEDYERAIDLLTKAKTKAYKHSQCSKADLADILVSLGRVYDKLGNYKNSLAMYDQAVEVIQDIKDMEYFLMSTLLHMARVAEKAGCYQISIKYSKKAIKIRKKIMSTNHLDYITSLNNLATLYSKNKEFENALKVHREVLDIVGNMLGEKHAYYADVISNIGADYCGLQQYNEAIEHHQKALQLKEEAVGKKHAQYVLSLLSLGTVYGQMKEYDQALSCYREALEIRNQLYHGDSGSCADVLIAIGNLISQKKDYQTAVKYYSDALQIRKRIGETQEPGYIWNLQVLGETNIYLGNVPEGISYFTQCLKLEEESFGKKHPNYAAVLKRLGKMYGKLQRLDDGISVLKKVTNIEQDMLGANSPRYWNSLKELGELYLANNQIQQALEVFSKLEKLQMEEDVAANEKELAICNLLIAQCYFKLSNKEVSWKYYQNAKHKFETCGCMNDEKINTLLKQFLNEFQSHKWDEKVASVTRKNDLEPKVEAKSAGTKTFLNKSEGNAKGNNIDKKRMDKIKLLLSVYENISKEKGQEDEEAVKAAITLGDVYRENSMFNEALYWYQEGESYGNEKEYAQCCLKESGIYLQIGQYQKAMEKIARAKAYVEEYGLVSQNEYKEIEELLQDLYDNKDLSVRTKDSTCLQEEADEALYKNQVSDHEKISLYSRKALQIREEMGETLEFAKFLLKTAEAHWEKENLKKAEVLFEKAVSIYEKERGENSSIVAKIMERMGKLYFEQEAWEKASECLERAYNISLKNKCLLSKYSQKRLFSLLWKRKEHKKLLQWKLGKKIE